MINSSKMQGFAKRYSLTCNSERTASEKNNKIIIIFFIYNNNGTVGNAILHGNFTMNNLAGVRKDSVKSAGVKLIKLVQM